MSGHSKWATIKRKKGANDAKRGKMFSKILREISIVAKKGGGNMDTNASLRTVAAKARAINMPMDNIKRAIQKGTGELPGASYEEMTYEGYGPGGVAVFIDGSTDNKNRTSAEMRTLFSKHGGNMGESGCVGWMFELKGVIVVSKEGTTEDDVMTVALDLGAEDISTETESFDITTLPENFEKVKAGLEAKKITIISAEVTKVPKNYVEVKGKAAAQVLALIDGLEDNDDVANVYTNADIPESEIPAE
ncbi:MAG: YebC/PmpR family DNA-binding transcriptional regulator [Candidatus Firestonebacteria bacterium]